MILTGNQIKWAKEQGYLDISDWDESRLNPNSYNLRLADEIGTYSLVPILREPYNQVDPSKQKAFIKYYDQSSTQTRKAIDKRIEKEGGIYIPTKFGLDMKRSQHLVIEKIPEEGFILEPGVLYLARTMEYTETHKFVPMLEGRSSVGRLGISIHSTAGFGDIGFCGYWTLEISCVQPVRIYPGVEICQIYYHTVSPDIWIPDDNNEKIIKYGDNGKYQKNSGIQPSMMWKEFKDE